MSFPNGTRNLKQQWCMFFDLLKVKYVTTPFAIPVNLAHVEKGERFRPDFYLPQNNLLISIVELRGLNAAKQLADVTEQIKMATGQPNSAFREFRAVCITSTPFEVQEGVELEVYFKTNNAYGGSDVGSFKFCMCPDCGAVGFEFDGRGARVCSSYSYPVWGDHINHSRIYRHEGDFYNLSHGDKAYSGHHTKIMTAAMQASVLKDEDALVE